MNFAGPKSFQFLTLGSTSGVTKIVFPSLANRLSDAIYIPGGYKFGQNNHTYVYVREFSLKFSSSNSLVTCHHLQVSSNGFFSFDTEVTYSTPQLFSSSSPQDHLVAPFWANNDISNRVGSISYEVHSSGTTSDYISSVSAFISQQKEVRFSGTWMLLAEWNSVPQFGGPLTIVSTKTNLKWSGA